MTRTQQTCLILTLGAVFLGGWFGVCRSLGWHARLAENNYQANLIRLETFLHQPAPPAVLVGSSMTGRLLPEYFADTSLAGVANLGLDGSIPDLGLDLVLSRKDPPAQVLVEVNTLLVKTPGNDATLRQALGSFSFRLAGWLPFLRAEYRPSSIIYSTLKLRQDRRFLPPSITRAPLLGVPLEPVPELSEQDRQATLAEPILVRHLARLRELQVRGARVIFYQLPGRTEALPPLTAEWAGELHIPLIRLGREMHQRGFTPDFTHGRHPAPPGAEWHLTSPSAEQASRVLAEVARTTKP